MTNYVDGDSRGSAPPRPRHRSRMGYAWQEFLSLPVLVVGVWVLLATAAIVIDRSSLGWAQAIDRALAVVIPPQTTDTLLSTITPGLLTVISIVFFVLVMAVQQQASIYSPVVLDQFLRRHGNQVFFGMFVGLTIYCVLVLGLIPPEQALMGTTLALLGSVVTFMGLLVFVYHAVDQVRATATVWMLQQLAWRARQRQQPLLSRCRSRPELPDAPATRVIASRVGYIVDIDGRLLARRLERVSGIVEIELLVVMGDHVVEGAALAEIRGHDSIERGLLAEAVLDALTLGRMRDIDRDAAQAVDNLSSMAWSATAGSQDPEGARIATEAMHSLLVAFQDQDRERTPTAYGGPLPVVYTDHLVEQLLTGFSSIIAASGQSGQHQTAASVLTILCRALPNLDPTNQKIAIDRLHRVLQTTMNHVFTSEIEQGFDAMHGALTQAELYEDARRILELKNDLRHYNSLGNPQRNP